MNYKEINFNNTVSVKKIERKINQFLSTIENNFLLSEGTGIRKSIITDIYSVENYLTFAFQAKLESALPDKKQFRAFIYSKVLAKMLEDVLISVYEKRNLEANIINSFPYNYVLEEKKDNQFFVVDCSHLSSGEFRYMDTFQVICYVRSKILNGQDLIEKSIRLLSNIKREILTEILNYNKMLGVSIPFNGSVG